MTKIFCIDYFWLAHTWTRASQPKSHSWAKVDTFFSFAGFGRIRLHHEKNDDRLVAIVPNGMQRYVIWPLLDMVTEWRFDAEAGMSLSDQQISKIVERTFLEADVDNNELVDLKEYQVRLLLVRLPSRKRLSFLSLGAW